LAREAQEASKVPLPTEESSSIASENGSEAVRLRELELEEKRAEREERRAEREDRRVELEIDDRKAAREAEAEARRLEAEERRAARELEERKAAREAEERSAEREARALEADRDARMKLEQAKLAHEIRVLELKAQQTQIGEDAGDDGATPSGRRGEGNLALQTKRFGEMMNHVLPKMPAESAELPQFSETVEKLYVMYAVPEVVQAKLLIPLLTAQAKSLVNRMSIEEMGKYDELKQFLLTEYKLTPHEYKTRFESATKTADETYTLFAARLRNLLTY